MIAPMLATEGSVKNLPSDEWAFEGKWDGHRMIVEVDCGGLTLRSRSGRNITRKFPQLAYLADITQDMTLDGEVVSTVDGVPDFAALHGGQGTPQFWAFDLLELDGHPMAKWEYHARRGLLETLPVAVPTRILGNGAEALECARSQGYEGVVAKRLTSHYRPGRSIHWVKDKFWQERTVVIGGWCGDSLLLGACGEEGLRYVGRVSDLAQRRLAELRRVLEPSRESPFDEPVDPGAVFVKPEWTGEVRYKEVTANGRLLHPSWRGRLQQL